MKIRIKGNSIRIRVTKSEVERLGREGCVEEHTSFMDNRFIYALQCSGGIHELSAAYCGNKITVFVPTSFAEEWSRNDLVGCSAQMQLNEKESLFLLLEKDFACLDNTLEDQSDNYSNPGKTC
ncbi:DUF7009 family protein [Flavihumibacter stibioxidans]|uniref:Uncharacterized protein n=1 Tax=Flavihumibacter stibioxidans TaxID=1834163 RepID=A0ABR7MB24_9BACT|nr:hypothetical protein [Flavihumibacter stibioxidans]MBC6492146.1 hypothetical protein [Flavihumibacter stibioxidans]